MRARTLGLGIALLGVLAVAAIAMAAEDAGGAGGTGGRGGGRGGNFDPAAFRTAQLDRIKVALGATDDEWTALKPRVEKVQDVQRQSSGRMGMMGGRGGRGGTGGAAGGAEQSDIQKKSQDLQTLLNNPNATPEQIKTALTVLRDARIKTEQELAQAQAALKELLTQRQEAVLVVQGLLK